MAQEKQSNFDPVTIAGLVVAVLIFVLGQFYLIKQKNDRLAAEEKYRLEHPPAIVDTSKIPANQAEIKPAKPGEPKPGEPKTGEIKPGETPGVKPSENVVTEDEPKNEGDITVKGDHIEATFTAEGATIRDLSLPDQYVDASTKDKLGLQVLAEIERGKRTFGLERFEIGPPGFDARKDRIMFDQASGPFKSLDKRVWKLASNSKGFNAEGKWIIEYSTTLAGKYALTKRFIIHKAMKFISLELDVTNQSKESVTFAYKIDGPAGILFDGPPSDPKKGARFAAIAAQLAGRDKPAPGETPAAPDVLRVDAKGAESLAEEKRSISRQENLWADLKNRFFVSMIVSIEPEQLIRLDAMAITPEPHPGDKRYDEPNLMVQGTRRESAAIESGKSAKTDRFALYAGPNTDQDLAQASAEMKTTEPLDLQEAFQYCEYFNWRWPRVDWIAGKMMLLFRGIHYMFGNYGIAVILLTLTIKVLMHPLQRKMTISMSKMQKIQPEIKKLQEKYKNQNSAQAKQKLFQEQQDLMKSAGASNFGCLPMFIQIPILTALYGIFNHAFEIRGATFMWIKDLSQPDRLVASGIPYVNELNLLPLLYAGIQLIQMQLYPQQAKSDDPQQEMQRKMMSFMPVFISFMCYTLPSGLLLYFASSACFGMIESYYIKKYLIKDTPLPPGGSTGGTSTAAAKVPAKAK